MSISLTRGSVYVKVEDCSEEVPALEAAMNLKGDEKAAYGKVGKMLVL